MTQHQIRIGVQVQPQHATWEKFRETVVDLDNLGADIIFNWDHFYPLILRLTRNWRRWPK